MMLDGSGCVVWAGATWPGVARCGWVTVVVGSQLGSQLGYLGHQPARQNGSVRRKSHGVTAGGVGGWAGIAVAEAGRHSRPLVPRSAVSAYLLRPGGDPVRRRAAQLVRRPHPAWGRLPDRLDDQHLPGRRVLRRVPRRRALRLPRPRRRPDPRDPDQRQEPGGVGGDPESRHRRPAHRPLDTVITTGDWIPENELARSAGLDIDPATRGPASTAPFAPAHPAFSPLATCCTLSTLPTSPRSTAARRRPGPAMAAHPPRPRLRRHPDRRPAAALDRPQILRPGDSTPARHRLLAWPGAYVPVPHVQVIQDGKVLASRRLPRPAPGRAFRIRPPCWPEPEHCPRKGPSTSPSPTPPSHKKPAADSSLGTRDDQTDRGCQALPRQPSMPGIIEPRAGA